MKKLLLTSFSFVVLIGSTVPFSEVGVSPAQAQSSGQCGLIQNLDRRAFCRARSENNSGQCGLIQNLDLRALCRAQVEKNSGQCGLIQDLDMRAECRASM